MMVRPCLRLFVRPDRPAEQEAQCRCRHNLERLRRRGECIIVVGVKEFNQREDRYNYQACGDEFERGTVLEFFDTPSVLLFRGLPRDLHAIGG